MTISAILIKLNRSKSSSIVSKEREKNMFRRCSLKHNQVLLLKQYSTRQIRQRQPWTRPYSDKNQMSKWPMRGARQLWAWILENNSLPRWIELMLLLCSTKGTKQIRMLNSQIQVAQLHPLTLRATISNTKMRAYMMKIMRKLATPKKDGTMVLTQQPILMIQKTSFTVI